MAKSRRRNGKRRSRKRGGVKSQRQSATTYNPSAIASVAFKPAASVAFKPAASVKPYRNIDKLKHFYVKKLQKDSGRFEPGALTQAHFKFSDSLYGNEIPVEVVNIHSMFFKGRSLFDPDPKHPDKYKGVVYVGTETEIPASLHLQKQNGSGEYVRDFINYWINVNPDMTLEDRSSERESGLQHQLSFV